MSKEVNDGVNFPELAKVMDEFREALSAMVAGLKADGFTDREARRLVTHMIAPPPEEGAENA